MKSEVVVRYVTRAAAHFVHRSQILAHHFHARAYAVAIAAAPHGFNEHAVVGVTPVVAQKRRRAIQVVDYYVDVAVVIDVSEGHPPTDTLLHEGVARLCGHL